MNWTPDKEKASFFPLLFFQRKSFCCRNAFSEDEILIIISAGGDFCHKNTGTSAMAVFMVASHISIEAMGKSAIICLCGIDIGSIFRSAEEEGG